jgi:RNA polymerase sigma-70 factor (ECF subfamily)
MDALITASPAHEVARSREVDPDDDIVRRVRGGDVDGALCCLMQRHGTAVYRYGREALQDAVLADDVHQHVFLDAFRDLPRFQHRSTLRVWLFAIARHRVLDAIRRRRRAPAYIDEAELCEPPDPRPSPEESIDDARLRAALVASIAELDANSRTALLLRYQQGFTFEEMATICGEKPGTLAARVMRALPRLRARIEALLGVAGDPGPRTRAA